jgi:hypothetical protein
MRRRSPRSSRPAAPAAETRTEGATANGEPEPLLRPREGGAHDARTLRDDGVSSRPPRVTAPSFAPQTTPSRHRTPPQLATCSRREPRARNGAGARSARLAGLTIARSRTGRAPSRHIRLVRTNELATLRPTWGREVALRTEPFGAGPRLPLARAARCARARLWGRPQARRPAAGRAPASWGIKRPQARRPAAGRAPASSGIKSSPGRWPPSTWAIQGEQQRRLPGQSRS